MKIGCSNVAKSSHIGDREEEEEEGRGEKGRLFGLFSEVRKAADAADADDADEVVAAEAKSDGPPSRCGFL